jgi:DNA-binding GntR family transcriptional regulator
MRFLGLRADSTWSRAWDEHAQLIGLLEKKDKESAARLMKTHLVNAVSDVLMGMKLVEPPATQDRRDSTSKNNSLTG